MAQNNAKYRYVNGFSYDFYTKRILLAQNGIVLVLCRCIFGCYLQFIPYY